MKAGITERSPPPPLPPLQDNNKSNNNETAMMHAMLDGMAQRRARRTIKSVVVYEK